MFDLLKFYGEILLFSWTVSTTVGLVSTYIGWGWGASWITVSTNLWGCGLGLRTTTYSWICLWVAFILKWWFSISNPSNRANKLLTVSSLIANSFWRFWISSSCSFIWFSESCKFCSKTTTLFYKSLDLSNCSSSFSVRTPILFFNYIFFVLYAVFWFFISFLLDIFNLSNYFSHSQSFTFYSCL